LGWAQEEIAEKAKERNYPQIILEKHLKKSKVKK